MSPIKMITLLAALFISASAMAQEGTSTSGTTEAAPELKSFSHWGVSVSSLSWNDKLKIREGIVSDTEYANYNGFILTLQKEFNIRRWGYTIGLFGGVGQANGGGLSSTITYLQSKVNFTVFGLSPRVFYRLSEKVSLGSSALIFSRQIDWPAESGQTIDAGRTINATILADINIRLLRRWDFYQGFGPVAEGATMWKLGLNYRF